MPAAQFLWPLLGSFIGDSTPQQNPNFKGITVDPQTGKPVYIGGEAPYSTPGFGTKLFHPDVASYEAGQNNAPYNLFNEANARKSLVGRQIQEAYPNEANPNAVAIQSGMNPQATAVEAGKNALARVAIGLPEASAAAEKSLAGFRTPFFQSETGLIPLRGATEASRLGSELTLNPEETQLRLGQIGAERGLLHQRFLSDLEAEKAREMGSQLSQLQLGTETKIQPLLARERENDAGLRAFSSQYGPPSPYPFGSRIENGEITPLTRNPLYAGPMAGIAAMTQGQGVPMSGGNITAGGVGVRLPNGQPLVTTAPKYNALTGRLIGPQQPVNVPFQASDMQNPGTSMLGKLIGAQPVNNAAWEAGMKQEQEKEQDLANRRANPDVRIKELLDKKTAYTITNAEQQELNQLLSQKK